MKPLFLSIILCFVAFQHQGFAQIKKDSLLGQWKLVQIIGKHIGDGELQKRYLFTVDSFFYTSRKKNLSGAYSLKGDTGKLSWFTQEGNEPMIILLKHLPDGRMEIWRENSDDDRGILEKIR
jgi:hypothetical protein